MNKFKSSILFLSFLLLSFLSSAQCGESAGSDESICFNNLPLSLSAPSGTEWHGDFITTSGLFNPDTPGLYEVVLVTSVSGCNDQDSKFINVLAIPEVNAGDDQVVCEFESFQINATASSENGNIVVWSWSGDDEFLNSTNISNPIASPIGASSFNLTVADDAGCFSFDQISLTIANLPIVTAGNDFEICHGLSSIPLAGSPSNGDWSGPGVSGDEFISPGVGTHTLEYSYTDALGCAGTDFIGVTVNELPAVEAGNDFTVCENEEPVTLIDYSPLGGFWSGDGVSLGTDTFNPAALSGSNSLTYSVGTGTCYNEASISVLVNPKPQVTILPIYDFCKTEDEVFLTDYSPSGGNWSGSIIHNGTLGTVYADISSLNNQVSYIYEDGITGCSDIQLAEVNVRELPSAAFSLESEGCVNADFGLTHSLSSDLDFEWFLDGDVASASYSPELSTLELGMHTVHSEVKNEFGCQKVSESQEIYVIDVPVAEFTTNVIEGCEPLEVSFDDSSSGESMSYVWDFQIANSISSSPGTINFGDVTDDTTYDVILEVSNDCGSSIHEVQVTSKAKPTAAFQTELSSVCSPVHTVFTNQSSSNSSSFLWSLGDGESSSEQVPNDKIYTTEDDSESFLVELVASNECGSHSYQETINVQPNPVSAAFSVTELEACAPVEISFENIGIGGTNIQYDLDGVLTTESNMTKLYTEPGIYDIIQYATDGCGFDTTSVEIVIYPAPVSDLIVTNGEFCIGDQVSISTTGETLSNFEWLVNGNIYSNESSINLDLIESGNLDFSLAANTELNNCSVELSEIVVVNPSPELDFNLSSQEACAPYTLNVENSGDASLFYSWIFNELTSNDEAPSFQLNETGNYDLDVSATNSFGCVTNEIYESVFFLNPTPAVDFTYNPGELHIITKPVADFQSFTEFADMYFWDFGDGNSSISPNPVHTYSTAGLFPVTLTASNSFGCSSELTMGVLVKDEFTLYVPNSFTPNGDGVNDVFKPVIEGNNFFDYSFSVFDRWGDEVFKSVTPNEGWIGNINTGSHYATNGIYSWELSVSLREGQGSKVYTGIIQILR